MLWGVSCSEAAMAVERPVCVGRLPTTSTPLTCTASATPASEMAGMGARVAPVAKPAAARRARGMWA